MARSLKSYIPRLARLLACSPAALYERQRALVRSGILGIQEGRGPGSGVHVNSYSVALLLIAILATDSLSDTSVCVAAIAMAKPCGRSKRCPITGRVSFADALAQILTNKNASRKIENIVIDRTGLAASINYKENGRSKLSDFQSAAKTASNLKIQATLSPAVVMAIADDLFELLLKAENDDSAEKDHGS